MTKQPIAIAQQFSTLWLCFATVVVAAIVPAEVHAAGKGKIVVANRNSDTISVIDAGTDLVVDTVQLPMFPGDAVPEPMYVVNTPTKNRVWVGDRANDRVVVFDGNNFAVEATVPCGDGVFHMAADQAGHQLWVVNNTDKTATVIDAKKLDVVATVPMPANLGAPHDIVLDSQGLFAYVTFLADDTVVQYETITFTEMNRAVVGISPHVAYNQKNDELYLPCQGSDAIFVLDAVKLSPVDIIPVPNAHGVITSRNSKRLYATNISDGGIGAIFGIDTKTNSVLSVADTPDTVPHNVTVTPDGKKLYVTHSGANDTVTVFDIKHDHLQFSTTIVVGENPFGLAHVQ